MRAAFLLSRLSGRFYRLSAKTKRGIVFGVVVLALGASFPRDNAFLDVPEPSGGSRQLTIEGMVSHVRDGDTIEIGPTAIRFAKLDCAERGTVAGDAATHVMRSLVQGERLTCDLEGRRSYDREIGTCRLEDGRDLGAVMIGNGSCGKYR